MFIYKMEVELKEQPIHLVVMAENDEQAFDGLEELLVRHFVRTPEVLEASIIEKKRAVKGAGYVIESTRS
ncbi:MULTISPECIES: DUF3906 family protein [unclassified Paenibacillus]|uniref:DUF3906 family protein n=1 Tax=unclassified Paenibacillus TaxID=185978 RepID=UPI001AE39804|nr:MULTISPECIES: DUF3906 family protein [unclassified Paenibacillus]MBP1154755.1 hypothetical protein [Paenibacillus sp. PvP091]MBP1169861.1 hypothetical protein [Paenibacillus sp. PvR098]MBP2440889.1 hypothetical protein [Paenibacillus sp. PvP052]